MKRTVLLLLCVASVAGVAPVTVRGQESGYPITLIAPGKGPFTFPAGYQTPWDKIRDHGDGEDVAESLRAARFAKASIRRIPTRRAAGPWRSSDPTAS